MRPEYLVDRRQGMSFLEKLFGRQKLHRGSSSERTQNLHPLPSSDSTETKAITNDSAAKAISPRETSEIEPQPVSSWQPVWLEDRVIRVFVSSTFRDMQAERDLLIKKAFPQLRKLCEERGVIWTEVDLRWGITTEQASEGKVLPFCLAEIQRCRPYFIGLLGERYGWVPKENEIPEDLLDIQPWLKENLDHSVTELEILHGVLNDPSMSNHSLFYFRDPAYIEKLRPEEKQNFAPENTESAEKLKKLKDRIHEEHLKGNLQYPPRDHYSNPEALIEMVLTDFTGIIDHLYPRDQAPNPLDQEAMRHDAYGRSRRMAFVGREDFLKRINEHVSTPNKPLVLTGESGCGKSALMAEWVARRRRDHPDDLIIQHYIGSTPESANWQEFARRILGEIKRAFAIADNLPMEPGALRTALQDWLTKAAGKRQVFLVLDALNQLSNDDASSRQLGWLPFTFPPNVHLLVSSLAGECLEVLQRRNWPELVVPLFSRDQIIPAALAYFNIFSKTPSQDILEKLKSASAACNPLYLRLVLDELRQFGKHEELNDKAADYLSAPDLPALFDKVLARWDEDFGKDPEYPDLVRRSICLIASARFGLSEAELLELLGKKGTQGEYEPLPHRYWTPFYLAAENALAHRTGLLAFGHDNLRAAVQRRWLHDPPETQSFRFYLADYFENTLELTERKLDELPTLLRDTGQWERLKNLLANLPVFIRLFQHKRWKWELHGFWMALEGRFDPADVYFQALSKADPALSLTQQTLLLNAVGTFLLDAGHYTGAETAFRRAIAIEEQSLGQEHPDTLIGLNNLARLLENKGDYQAAEPLFRRAMTLSEQTLGPEHPHIITFINNLAGLLTKKGDYLTAEPLFRRAMALSERTLGPEHPDTITVVNDLAFLLEKKGSYEAAELFYKRALDSNEKTLGPNHPNTITSLNNLAGLWTTKGDYAVAEIFYKKALDRNKKVFGPDHPETLFMTNNLAMLLEKSGDYEAAEPLLRRVLASRERVLGPDHPDTITSINNLAGLLNSKGDNSAAESLFRRALSSRERALGPDHPDTIISINNLAGLLNNKGDYDSAESLYLRALKISERILGSEHPDTLRIINDLALLLQNFKEDYRTAETLFRRALSSRERILGPDHPDTITTLSNMAGLLRDKEDYVAAEAAYKQSLERSEQVLGLDHPLSLHIVNDFALFLKDIKKDYYAAEPLYRRVLSSRERILGPGHPSTLTSVNNLARLLAGKGDHLAAEPLMRRTLEGFLQLSMTTGQPHPFLNASINNYAELLGKTGCSQEEIRIRLNSIGQSFGIRIVQ
jgi:nephrocystin-3